MYFPEQLLYLEKLMISAGFESTWVAWTAYTIVFGLLLSSICFSIELGLRKLEGFNNRFPVIQVILQRHFDF